MGPSAEALLVLAILGLYLYDATTLLCCNEAVFSPAGRRGWDVGFGSRHMGIRGKELFIPNPLLLHRPTFRLVWSLEDAGEARAADLQPASLLPLAPALWGMAVGMLVLLPLGFFTALGERALLSGLLLIYVNLVLALTWTWLNRSPLQLSPWRFAALAFESLVCPPFALNLVRHLSLQMQPKEDAIHAARRLQGPEDWSLTRDRFRQRLDDEIDLEEVNSARWTRLIARRNRLTGGREACQE
ncbi:MAG: hypothetical protein IPL58_08190 [Betaproteobacteria bacterium]|uniref:Uncharacterized protein n=1 Tax=Candidatus Proximibacter danicus TaxID=2954365 RepID=A0A9D7K1L6_9PROT|nr:hypothetical protein [Candidatus Proximibacter danicus]